MVDRKELEALISRARLMPGTKVVVNRDGSGFPLSVRVEGVKGIGPFPMSAISFAERMREVL